jgi:hypothetical protein
MLLFTGEDEMDKFIFEIYPGMNKQKKTSEIFHSEFIYWFNCLFILCQAVVGFIRVHTMANPEFSSMDRLSDDLKSVNVHFE